MLTFAHVAWTRPERDHQYVATKLLRRHVELLPAGAIEDLEILITTKSWWDTVDELSRNVVGPLVLANPELVAVMDEWIDDDHLWLARTAIVHQGTYKERTDPDRLFRYCLRRAADTDFFLRKAIGWALRDYSKVDEAAVRAFVAAHRRRALGPLDARGPPLPRASRRHRRPEGREVAPPTRGIGPGASGCKHGVGIGRSAVGGTGRLRRTSVP